MPTGQNTVGTFNDSLDDIRSSARVIREASFTMGQIVDKVTLKSNTGTAWKEVALSKLYAANIDELTDLEQSPQEIIDTLFSVTPTMVGMSVFMTDLVKMRINAEVASKLGVLSENAMSRKKDQDLIAIGQTATSDLGTAGNPMASDLISAAAALAAGNTTEPWDGSLTVVMRTFQLKDIQDEGVAGFGTYPTAGADTLTEKFLRQGFSGELYGTEVRKDDNMTVDGSDDAIAFVTASGPNSAIVLVQGASPRRVTMRKEGIGGGAEIMFATDQYQTGIRQQAWIRAITADSSSPTA